MTDETKHNKHTTTKPQCQQLYDDGFIVLRNVISTSSDCYKWVESDLAKRKNYIDAPISLEFGTAVQGDGSVVEKHTGLQESDRKRLIQDIVEPLVQGVNRTLFGGVANRIHDASWFRCKYPKQSSRVHADHFFFRTVPETHDPKPCKRCKEKCKEKGKKSKEKETKSSMPSSSEAKACALAARCPDCADKNFDLGVYTCWTPLTKPTAVSSHLRVVPGSHRFIAGFATKFALEHEYPEDLDDQMDRLGLEWVDLTDVQPGDIVVFHRRTIHAASVHADEEDGSGPRLSCDVRIQTFRPEDKAHPIGERMQAMLDTVQSAAMAQEAYDDDAPLAAFLAVAMARIASQQAVARSHVPGLQLAAFRMQKTLGQLVRHVHQTLQLDPITMHWMLGMRPTLEFEPKRHDQHAPDEKRVADLTDWRERSVQMTLTWMEGYREQTLVAAAENWLMPFLDADRETGETGMDLIQSIDISKTGAIAHLEPIVYTLTHWVFCRSDWGCGSSASVSPSSVCRRAEKEVVVPLLKHWWQQLCKAVGCQASTQWAAKEHNKYPNSRLLEPHLEIAIALHLLGEAVAEIAAFAKQFIQGRTMEQLSDPIIKVCGKKRHSSEIRFHTMALVGMLEGLVIGQ